MLHKLHCEWFSLHLHCVWILSEEKLKTLSNNKSVCVARWSNARENMFLCDWDEICYTSCLYCDWPPEQSSWLFAVLASQWWNVLPIDMRSAETVHICCCAYSFQWIFFLQTENSSVQTAPWPMKKKKYLFLNVALGALWSSLAYLMKPMYLHYC